MQVFLSHSAVDKDVVEPIGAFLKNKGLDVWIDSWAMTPGDSLISRIGEGIENSDRLIVFLSPNSVESNWVKKEIATGIVMELAEEKGLGDKFVIPALLVPCKIPIMLRDKLYSNFTNKAFDAACEELLSGLLEKSSAAKNSFLENRLIRMHQATSEAAGLFALTIEFAVRISPTEGLHIGIDFGDKYESVVEWFAPPNQPLVPSNFGGVFTDSSTRRDPTIYARKFSSPSITSTKSYYVRVEGKTPLYAKAVQFLDFFDRIP